jgi:A/G-specific adenine glycosylase
VAARVGDVAVARVVPVVPVAGRAGTPVDAFRVGGALAAIVGIDGSAASAGVPAAGGASAGAPPLNSRVSRKPTKRTTSSVTTRRRQYTAGGSGPTGRPIALGSTLRKVRTYPDPIREARRARMRAAMRSLHEPILRWYAGHARDLPWRHPDATPWAILVSEIMLQQTPVSRVLPEYDAWLARWPTPAALADAPPGEAVRQWGRLGYPRRALRLREAAIAIVERHGGEVPADHAALRSLPGIGTYTAAAVAAFAFGHRHAVVDTNVRRVLARLIGGAEQPSPTATAAESRLAESLLPAAQDAPRWSVAVMELGALVCAPRAPKCADCPVAAQCAWRLAGKPAYDGPARRGQSYAGTDRQARGRLLGVLRESMGPVPRARLDAVWHDEAQRTRALAGLVADGLVEPLGDDRYRLPGAD